jgi:glycosyltransferase involved in cell wall biosynthesis
MTGSDIYLDPIITKLSNIIVTNSMATAKRFGENMAQKVKVIHNGVDLEWLRGEMEPDSEALKKGWDIILVVSRISRWKRHDLALDAFEQVAAVLPNAHLVCVGAKDQAEPRWWAYVYDKSRNSPFRSRIHWIGHVEDIRPWYRAASILLLPSVNEPFGRVVVESMALGVPVVAMNSGGIPEIVRHGEDGVLVTHLNGSEIADACLWLLGDPSLREKMGQSCKERAEMFSLHEHVRKMVEVFEEASG